MTRNTLALTVAALCLAISLPVFAQEKHQVSYKTSAETSKYTQQLNLNAADVPNHVVRAFELHRVPSNPAVINGVKLVEDTSWGLTDLGARLVPLATGADLYNDLVINVKK
jgi:hypothetical protein